MSKEYTRLLIDNRGDLCWVTINRPGDRNSIDSVMMEELLDFLEDVEDTGARALVFTGAGNAYFIGGADGIEMMQCEPPAARRFSEQIQSLFNRMEASPLILVAAINGLCFGGGFEFALACDLRVAGQAARIGLPEVKVGIIPGGGGTQRLPALVGSGRAMEMILSGKLFRGNESYARGLVHRVAAPGELAAEVSKLLAPIFRNPQFALSQAKHAVRASQYQSFDDGLQAESEAFSQCFKQGFFVRLMKQQLQEGTLETTVPLPDWVHEDGKEKS